MIIKKVINSGVKVYNTQNTVAIAKKVHHEISKFYLTYNYELRQISRQYVNKLSYKEQYKFGIDVLKNFSDNAGIVPYFLK